MTQKNHVQNPWTAKDERGHASQTLEWWSIIGFFTTQENQKQWSIKATLSEGFVNKKQIDSLCNITLFDPEANRHYVSYMRIPGVPLRSRQDAFDVGLNDSFMKGSYPAFEVHFRDPDQDIEIDFSIQAESFPHWVAQEATNGWVPMGLGFLRYGFIPKTRISGTIKIHEKLFTIKGTGYFEHVWGISPIEIRSHRSKAVRKQYPPMHDLLNGGYEIGNSAYQQQSCLVQKIIH